MPVMPVGNYGLLNGLAQGANSFLNAWQTGKNLQYDRQKEEALTGLIRDQDGNVKAGPQLLAKQQAEADKAKAVSASASDTTQGFDPNSQATIDMQKVYQSAGVNAPDGISAAHLERGEPLYKAKLAADAANNRMVNNPLMAVKQQSVDEGVHARALKDVQDDPITKQLVTSTNNLANAKANFEKGGATPQDFAELQQTVRANLGIKGTSGVGERESSYLKSLGIKADSMKQFISGNPQSVMDSDPAFAKQIMGLVDLEMKNKAAQAGKQIDQKAAGHQGFYNKPGHEQYSQDFNNVVNQQKAQFGLLGGGQQAPAGHPQDSAALQWAKSNPNDPRSAAIMKANGQ